MSKESAEVLDTENQVAGVKRHTRRQRDFRGVSGRIGIARESELEEEHA